MLFRHSALAFDGGGVRNEFREFVVDPLFSTRNRGLRGGSVRPPVNLVRRFLVELVEVGVMVSFAWLAKPK